MIDWQGTGEQRLRSWRQFRLSIANSSKDEVVGLVNHEWSYCPFINKYLSPHDPTYWPDPWTLLSDGKFCSLARSLGMLYTLTLCEQYLSIPLSINIYSNVIGERYDLVLVDNKYVLNYIHDTVVDIKGIDSELVLQYQYNKEELNTSSFQ